jgi:hypothetical protein
MFGFVTEILFIFLICSLIVSKSPLSIGPDRAFAGLIVLYF